MSKTGSVQLKRWLSGFLVFSLILSLIYLGGVEPVYASELQNSSVKTNEIDNTFRPNNPVTRAELAAILSNLMKYQVKAENKFSDLGNKWYTDAMLGANASGIIVGSENKLRPEDNATREETAVMLSKALAIKGGGASKFTDSGKISGWAVDTVNAMAEIGYINGLPDGSFNPEENFVFITDPRFGAVGDGSDETAKVQAALDYVGDYGTVYIPRGTFYVPGGLQLKIGQTLAGFGFRSSILQGDGTQPIIKTNTSVNGTIRYLRLFGLGIDNFTRATTGGAYACQWWAANDSHIQYCEFKSKAAEALHVLYSYRGSITQNRITSNGSSFAFALLNNCNGINASNNTVSGGSAGSGVRIGMSQCINLSNTVIEVAGGVAVRVGGNDGVDGGRCTGINLKGLYAEQTKRVLEAGLMFECYGIELDGFIINQASTSVIASYDEAFHLGRVNGLTFDSGFATGGNQTALIKLYDIAAGVGWTPYLSGSRLKSKAITGYTEMFSFDGTTHGFSARIFGRNEIALNSDEVTGSIHEYISPIITCSAAVAQKLVVPPTTYGGIILSIDVIDATGALDGTLRIGSSVGIIEVLTKDMSTVALNKGYASLTTESNNGFIRTTGLLMSTVAGVATTSYRVKIRYRV